jgi:hypothetical protein
MARIAGVDIPKQKRGVQIAKSYEEKEDFTL